MKTIKRLATLMILWTSIVNASGGMTSGEPVVPFVRSSCFVQSIDPTFTTNITQVVQYIEPINNLVTFGFLDKQGIVLFYLPGLEVTDSQGSEFELFQYRDYVSKVGSVNFQGAYPGVKSLSNNIPDLLFTTCNNSY